MSNDNPQQADELLVHFLTNSDKMLREQSKQLHQIQIDIATFSERMDNRQEAMDRLEQADKDLERGIESVQDNIKSIEKSIDDARVDSARAHERVLTLWKAGGVIVVLMLTTIVGIVVKLLGG